MARSFAADGRLGQADRRIRPPRLRVLYGGSQPLGDTTELTTAPTLKPEDRISHYRVVGPLGAGGMGEVYRAHDESLERDVALKILPPALVRSEERLRRFVLEAKSASSLNHPNIVTIYEIGQADVGSAPLHFISMELVTGETLATKIHGEKTGLKTMLGWLAQAAEGLAKAHGAGIVHRDLKPGNIMVSHDGYAKVLDFGLAKLTERPVADTDRSAAPTMTEEHTSDGVVLGTVGYMSPEQVQGKSVDHRSDIFSFGCILYEAATRKQPFVAASSVETMHKILHDTPAPVEELNAQAPAELRRLIRRCLAKDPNRRLDSMKALAIELHEIADEYDTLSASASSGSGKAPIAPPKRRIAIIPLVAIVAVVATVSALIGIWLVRRPESKKERTALESMQMTTVTNRGDVVDATLSPDGKYLAYFSGPPDHASLRVRQLATEADVEIVPPQKTLPSGLRYSRDGSYLFYLSQGTLYEISSLGGTPRRRVVHLDSPVSFSPDEKSISFLRVVPEKKQFALIVSDLEKSQERILATFESPQVLMGATAWSPDGARIAVAEFSGWSVSGGPRQRVVTFRVDDGRRESVGPDSWQFIFGLAWLPDGGGLVLSAPASFSMGASAQIWLLPFPGGGARKVTNDTNSYQRPSVSSDGTTLAVVRPSTRANIWTVEAAVGGRVRQLTFGSTEESAVDGEAPASDGSIVFVTGSHSLRKIGLDDSRESSVLPGGNYGSSFDVLADGGVVFSRFDEQGVGHVWRVDRDGANARQLASIPGGEYVLAVSPDGRAVLVRPRDHLDEVWAVVVEGGEPVRIASSTVPYARPIYSPDGKRILYSVQSAGVHDRQVWKLISDTGGDAMATLSFPSQAQDLEWDPDGQSITFVDQVDGVENIFRQSLGGGRPVQLTHFAGGTIQDHEWSPDGRRLALIRRAEHQNLWLTGPDGSHPIQLTQFQTGSVFSVDWVPSDGRRLCFLYGQESSDVVLIKNFR